LREKLGIDPRFTLYTLRHWYVTMGFEAGVDAALMSELAGHADPSSIEFYKKIRNHRLHEGARQVADAIERAGMWEATPPSRERE
jgi:site-specific recombinase XerD